MHQSVPSPEFFHFAISNPFTGHPYILMEWIDGLRMEDVILDLEPGEAERLGRSVGSALAAIHSFKFEHAGFFDSDLNVSNEIDRIDLGGAGLISYARECLVDGAGGERLGLALSQRILEFLNSEACLLDEWKGQPCLSHSDFGGSNMLVSKGAGAWELVAVLDWEFAFSGTPFIDFGNVLRAPHGTAPGFETGVLEGYLSAGGQVPEEWRKMSLLTDLNAWMEFMTRKDPGDSADQRCAPSNFSNHGPVAQHVIITDLRSG